MIVFPSFDTIDVPVPVTFPFCLSVYSSVPGSTLLKATVRAGLVPRLLLLGPAMGIALLAVVASWVNPYEQMMFHPFGEPRYVTIQQAGVDAKDMVIAVTLGGESRAYPIREMGYHHVVNDRLHQLPIVVTY